MSGTTTNLIQGVGYAYWGLASATEPADTAIATPPAGLTSLGLTKEGVALTTTLEYEPMDADQLVDTPESRLTKREFKVATSLAEATLENLARAMNEPLAQVVTTGQQKALSPRASGAALQGSPQYGLLVIDGYAPGGLRRRVICRRVLQVGEIEAKKDKAEQTVFPVEFMAHYVSETVPPVRWVDALS